MAPRIRQASTGRRAAWVVRLEVALAPAAASTWLWKRMATGARRISDPRAATSELAEEMVRMLVRVRRHLRRR